MRRGFQPVALGLLFAVAAPSAFAQSADLGIQKTGPNTAAAGTDVTFVITATSSGPDDAANAVITDAIPAGMTFTSVLQTSGPTFTCTQNAGVVTCNAVTFAAGSTATFNFVFHIPNGTPDGTLFVNTATIGSDTPDDNSENNSSIWGTSTPPAPTADISILKTGPTSAPADTDVTYTIVIQNPSSAAATNVTWQDTLPTGVPGGAQMTFVSLSPPAGCTTGTTINCDVGTLAANSSITYTLVGHIPPGTPSGISFTNTAVVNSSNDQNAENNTSSTTLTVSSVDVSVTKSGPATAIAGNPYSYTITVANAGPDVAQNVTVTDVLPAGVTFVSAVQNTGPAGACAGGGTVTCNIALLFAGQSAQFTLTVTAGNVNSVSNTATVTTDSFDTNTMNNSSTATTIVTPQSDLSISKIGPPNVVAGSNITYSIHVTNNGPSDATSVSLTDVLPPNTTFVSFTAPPGWTTATGATVTASSASVPAGSTATFTLVVQVNAATPGGTTISNTANVASATPDPSGGNNASTATTPVATGVSDVSITKTISPLLPVYPTGFNVTFTLTARNAGPNAASGVTVTDPLPSNVTFVSASSTQGTCSGTTTVICTVGTLAVGGSATITIVVHTATEGSATNTATISSASADSNPANNTATVAFLISANIPALSPMLLALLAAALAAIALIRE